MSRMDLRPFHLMLRATAKIAVLPAFVFGHSSKTSNIEFAHIDSGLTIKVEESSPPLALLEDERIPVLKTGGQELSLLAGIPLLAGESDVASRALAWNSTEDSKFVEVSIERQESKTLVASSITVSPSSYPTQGPSGAATSGERVPSFGEPFRKNTVIKSDPNGPSAPGRQAEDMLIDTMTASSGPVVSFRRLAGTHSPATEPLLHGHVTMGQTAAGQSATREGSDKAYARQDSPSDKILKGLIELTNGLAVADKYKLLVTLEFADQELAAAEVDVQQGTFELPMPQDASGMLVAVLLDPNGKRVGKGESPVQEILRDPNHRLYVAPVAGMLRGIVRDAYNKPTRDADVRFSQTDVKSQSDRNGAFQFEKVAAESQVILSSSRLGHWGTRTVSESSSKLEVTLFPDKMMEALHQLSGIEVDREKGIIWGHVEASGQPVQGASVELTDATAIGPIYFNQMMLPEKSLKATSSNGLFAYLKVQPGVHAVQANLNGREFPSRIVSIQSGNVSPLAIETMSTATGRVLVYDALDGEPLEALVRIAGSGREAATLQGQVALRYYKGQDLMFIEADAGPSHHVGRITISRTSNVFKIPMIRKAWLNELSGQARISQSPSSGVVVGFVQGDEFTIGLPDNILNAEVLYFDSAGRFVGRNSGPAGGGFVIFNLEAGMQQISIVPFGGGGFSSKVVHSDGSGVHLLNVSF